MFQKGDRVIVTNDLNLAKTDNAFNDGMIKYLGKAGVVVDRISTHADVKMDDDGTTWFFKDNLLTKEDKMNNTDKYMVHITNKNSGQKGYWAEGKIEQAVPKHQAGILTLDKAESIKKQFEERFQHWVPVIEKVETEATKEVKVQKFKVGDKVKLVKGTPSWYDNDIGKTGVIDKVWDNTSVSVYGITFDDGKMGPALNGDYFELLEVKKKPLNFMRSNNKALNIIANGKSYTVAEDHPNYKLISQAIVDGDASQLDDLVNPVKAVVKFASVLGVEVKDGVLYKDGQKLHGVIADKIISLHRDGLPIEPLVKFYNNLMDNPSKRAVEELYPFLEHKGLPITDDGCFLGYKRVREDWTDQHSGKVLNKIGMTIEMKRNLVDDNWRTACSSGYHVGSIEYVRHFGTGTGHVVIVKVNPKDVVAVPSSEVTKLRTCKYEVVQEYDRDLVDRMPDRLHTADGRVYEIEDDDTFWEDWEDYEEDELDDDLDVDEDETGFSNEDYSRGFGKR